MSETDSNSSARPIGCSFVQARDALRSCQETLLSRKPDYDNVLAALRPFEGCTDLTGASPGQSRALWAMIQATLADCYRERQDFERAAELYRQAGRHRPIMGFEELYAEMVLKQTMQAHYGYALQCLRAAQEDSRGDPFLKRMSFQASALWRDALSLKFRNPFKSWYLTRRLNRLTRSDQSNSDPKGCRK